MNKEITTGIKEISQSKGVKRAGRLLMVAGPALTVAATIFGGSSNEAIAGTPTPVRENTPTAVPHTATPAPTETPLPTREPSPTPVLHTATPAPTETPKATKTPSSTPTREATPTKTPHAEKTPTSTPTREATPTKTPHAEKTPTTTPTATSTPTKEKTPTPTATPKKKESPTPTPTIPPFQPPTAGDGGLLGMDEEKAIGISAGVAMALAGAFAALGGGRLLYRKTEVPEFWEENQETNLKGGEEA